MKSYVYDSKGENHHVEGILQMAKVFRYRLTVSCIIFPVGSVGFSVWDNKNVFIQNTQVDVWRRKINKIIRMVVFGSSGMRWWEKSATDLQWQYTKGIVVTTVHHSKFLARQNRLLSSRKALMFKPNTLDFFRTWERFLAHHFHQGVAPFQQQRRSQILKNVSPTSVLHAYLITVFRSQIH